MYTLSSALRGLCSQNPSDRLWLSLLEIRTFGHLTYHIVVVRVLEPSVIIGICDNFNNF